MARKRPSIIAAVADIHPWSWVVAIYGLQLVASVAAVRLFNLPFEGMLPSLVILTLGALVGLMFRHTDDPNATIGLKWLLPALIYCGFIFSLSHRSFPGARIPVDTSFFHPFEFMTLGIFLCCLAMPVLRKKGRIVFAALVLVVGGIYGVLDEIHQAWVPGRKADPMDVVLDVVGLCIGIIVFLGSQRLKRIFTEMRENSTHH